MTGLNELEKSPYFSVILDFALSTPMAKRRSPKHLVSGRMILHENNGYGYQNRVIPAVYETNFCHGLEFTPSGASRIAVGNPRDKDLEELENDLYVAAHSGLFETADVAFNHLF